MADTNDTRGKLRALRDRLSMEVPRARTRAGVPAELAGRLQSALEMVTNVFKLDRTAATEEAVEDAIIEANMTLVDWDRWARQEKQDKQVSRPPTAGSGANRRQYERFDTNVTVKLLRHGARDQGKGVVLDSQSLDRPARNVSIGGIFVAVAKIDLGQLGVGSIVHVSVSAALGKVTFQVRAVVIRRDDEGVALRWMPDNDDARRGIEALVASVQNRGSG